MSGSEGLSEVAATGDRLATLRALRDRLAHEIEHAEQARDVAALSRQLTDVLGLIEAGQPVESEGSPLDELAKRRSAGGADSTRQARSSRR